MTREWDTVAENHQAGYPAINRELANALMPTPFAQHDLDRLGLTFWQWRITSQAYRPHSQSTIEGTIFVHLSERESASASEIARTSSLNIMNTREYIQRPLDGRMLDPIGTLNSPKRHY